VEASHNPAELILHVGDLSYADGNPHIWDSFLEGLQPFAASVPYMVAVGNHEVMPEAEPSRLGDTIMWHVVLSFRVRVAAGGCLEPPSLTRVCQDPSRTLVGIYGRYTILTVLLQSWRSCLCPCLRVH